MTLLTPGSSLILVTDTRPSYCGFTIIDCRISNVDERHPLITEFVGRGNLFAFSEGKGLGSQRNGNDSVRIYPCLKVPEHYGAESGLNWKDTNKVKQHLLDTYYQDWDSRLRDLLIHIDDGIRPWPIYHVPLDARWETRKGVTLVGDAAHVIAPFAGEGVNLGMLDSLDLAHAIIENQDLEAAIRQYELKIHDRATEANKYARKSMELAFAGDAPKGYSEYFIKTLDEGFTDGDLPEYERQN